MPELLLELVAQTLESTPFHHHNSKGVSSAPQAGDIVLIKRNNNNPEERGPLVGLRQSTPVQMLMSAQHGFFFRQEEFQSIFISSSNFVLIRYVSNESSDRLLPLLIHPRTTSLQTCPSRTVHLHDLFELQRNNPVLGFISGYMTSP